MIQLNSQASLYRFNRISGAHAFYEVSIKIQILLDWSCLSKRLQEAMQCNYVSKILYTL